MPHYADCCRYCRCFSAGYLIDDAAGYADARFASSHALSFSIAFDADARARRSDYIRRAVMLRGCCLCLRCLRGALLRYVALLPIDAATVRHRFSRHARRHFAAAAAYITPLFCRLRLHYAFSLPLHVDVIISFFLPIRYATLRLMRRAIIYAACLSLRRHD